MTLQVGSRLGHYDVTALIGEGGMGQVYQATDTKLNRQVALKILPEAFASDPDRLARFQREAQVLASLNHPGIAAIYGIEEQDDARALVLELVEGPTLADRIRKGPIPLDEALPIAKQIAEALEAAHEAGVIHRDLKPANIKVREDGTVKVLDFGLAKKVLAEALPEATTETRASVTQAGSFLGTLPYMAPEQLMGKPADARSDIWALGLVLYEMVAGERPFKGKTGVELSSAILHQSPDPLPRRVPAGGRAIIERCLAKDPAQRYQQARDVRAALEHLHAGAALVGAVWTYGLSRRRLLGSVSAVAVALVAGVTLNVGGVRDLLPGVGDPPASIKLAVLPFENLTGDPEQEYFTDGITAEMISQLGRLNPERLGVIARTSAVRYKQTDKPIDEIGQELGVEYILEGSARREGNRVRITAQLVQVRDQLQVWTDSYERDLAGILAVQGDVAQGVAESLAIALLPGEQIRLANVDPVNPDVYEAYLRGMFYINQFTLEGWERGSAYLRQAIEIDPADPLAYVGLALAYSVISSHAPFDFPEGTEQQARAAALRALSLDETVAGAHAALAQLNIYQDRDWEGAEQAFRRALELNPNLAEAHAHYGWYLYLFGSREEALSALQRAEQVDPLNHVWIAWQGDLLWYEGDYDRSIEFHMRALELSPEYAWSLHHLGLAYAAKGMYEEALAAHEEALALVPYYEWGLGHAYALTGRTDEARAMAAELEAAASPDAWALAHIYAALGERDESFRWMTVAFDSNIAFAPWLKGAPFALLRDDERVPELRRRMGLPG